MLSHSGETRFLPRSFQSRELGDFGITQRRFDREGVTREIAKRHCPTAAQDVYRSLRHVDRADGAGKVNTACEQLEWPEKRPFKVISGMVKVVRCTDRVAVLKLPRHNQCRKPWRCILRARCNPCFYLTRSLASSGICSQAANVKYGTALPGSAAHKRGFKPTICRFLLLRTLDSAAIVFLLP